MRHEFRHRRRPGPIDTREFEFGSPLKQITFDAQQSLVTAGLFFRQSRACASPQFRGVVLDTRFYRGTGVATLTATCDSFLNSFVISPTGQIAARYNFNRLAYLDWVNTPATTTLPVDFSQLLWRGTTLEVTGVDPMIRLLQYSPLVN